MKRELSMMRTRQVAILLFAFSLLPLSFVANAESTPSIEFRLASLHAQEGYSLYTGAGSRERKLYLKNDAVLTSEDIKTVTSEKQSKHVLVRLNKNGAVKLSEVTERNVGRRLAILIDGVVVSSPVINAKIEGGLASINLLTPQRAEELIRKFPSRRDSSFK